MEEKNPLKQARLDFYLISENLSRSLQSSTIEPSHRSDHSLVILNLSFQKFKPGRGLWKFNNSLLYDKEYIDLINEKILEIKKQYIIPVYNYQNIEQIDNREIQFQINDQLFLETLLLEIRGKNNFLF